MARLAPMWWTAAVVFVLDQITKVIVVQWMDLKNEDVIEFWDPFITFKMAWNRGINFGLFSDTASNADLTRWILIGVAIAISAWIIWWMQKSQQSKWVLMSAGLVVGGAIGNVIDRIIYGAVADFLNMSCCGFENPWSFNVADIAIFVGAVGLIFLANDGKDRDGAEKAG